MPNAYQPAAISKREPNLPIALSHEARIWATTKTIASHDFPHPIADLSFSPVFPYDLAVAHGNSISLVSQKAGNIRKSFTRFRDIVYSPRFKHDGRLLVAGTGDGVAKLFDVKSRTPLRTFTGHRAPVRSTMFTADGLHVMTGSDDTTVRIWDIAEGKNLFTLDDATDYVRAQNYSPSSRHVWVTASFDRKARLYDLRTRKCIFTLNHGSQIDDVHILPGGGLVLTVGGPDVRLWDLFSGGKMSNSLSCHAKAVTAATIDSTNNRLVTAGLDGFAKVHDLVSLQTKGVIRIGAQVLSIDMADDSCSFAVGMADGAVQVRAMRQSAESAFAKSKKVTTSSIMDFDDDLLGWGRGFNRVDEDKGPRPGSRAYFNRGPSMGPSEGDAVVMPSKPRKLAEHDRLLKNFDHRGALLRAMETDSGEVLVTVAQEMMNRNNVVSTLQAFNISELVPLLKLIKKNIGVVAFCKEMVLILDVLLDVHAAGLGGCDDAVAVLRDILENVEKEVGLCNDLCTLNGGAEMMLSVCGDSGRL